MQARHCVTAKDPRQAEGSNDFLPHPGVQMPNGFLNVRECNDSLASQRHDHAEPAGIENNCTHYFLLTRLGDEYIAEKPTRVVNLIMHIEAA